MDEWFKSCLWLLACAFMFPIWKAWLPVKKELLLSVTITAIHCLFRLIKLQPGECLFPFLAESSSFLFSLFFVPLLGAFHSVWNCTCSLLFFSVFHFHFTTFGWRPFSEKTIQGSLHLICTINRLSHFRKNTKQMQKQARWRKYIKVVSRSPHPSKAWLPWVLWNVCFSCCSIML